MEVIEKGKLKMKIAIPVEEKTTKVKSSAIFGRAKYFLIYDSEIKETKFIENGGLNSHGGAGIKAAQGIIDQNVEVLICSQCGVNAVGVMEHAHIEIYKTQFVLAMDNVQAFLEGKLSRLDDYHGGYHHGGR